MIYSSYLAQPSDCYFSGWITAIRGRVFTWGSVFLIVILPSPVTVTLVYESLPDTLHIRGRVFTWGSVFLIVILPSPVTVTLVDESLLCVGESWPSRSNTDFLLAEKVEGIINNQFYTDFKRYQCISLSSESHNEVCICFFQHSSMIQ